MTNSAPAYVISWERFSDDGKMAANGKPFNHTNLTCACRQWPLGTVLIITESHNGISVRVVVTDRTSRAHKNRIDLSPAAFAKLDGLELGICKATVKVSR